MAFTAKFWAIGAAGAVLYAVAGCNAVLGIEPAQPDPTGGTGGTGGTSSASGGTGATSGSGSVLTPNYDVLPDCSTCLANNCQPRLSACLADTFCRQALGAFSDCIHEQPNDQLTCQEKLGNFKDSTGAGDQPAIDLYYCIRDNGCRSPCTNSPFVSFCQLYCSCMPATCKGGDASFDCNAVCLAQSSLPDKLECLWDHCEVAFQSTVDAVKTTHCRHADDSLQACPDTIKIPCMLGNGVPNGFACKSTDDCCQGECNASGVCQ